MELLEEIHPGEILQEEFLRPLRLSVHRLARNLEVAPSRISELIHGRWPITPDTALRLGLFFQQDPRFWLQLRIEYDLCLMKRERQAELRERIPAFPAESETPVSAQTLFRLPFGTFSKMEKVPNLLTSSHQKDQIG